MTTLRIVAALLIAYLLGAIPWALIVGKLGYGVDVRERGSGNLGATNVLRTLGVRAAIATYVLDFGKGLVGVLIAWALVPVAMGGALHEWTLVAATLAVMLGHSYSPYVKMRGGKGVAVASGALLVVTPLCWPLLLGIFVVVVALSRMVSLGSIVIAAAYPALTIWLYGDQVPFVVFSFAAAALVIWRHRSNIARIARGTEPRVSFKRGGSSRSEEDS